MADPPRQPNTGADTGDHGSPAGSARWVAVVGILLAILLVVLLIVLHVTGTLGPGAH
jgi:hypothetical protein